MIATFADQETLNRQFELFEQSHQAIRDFFLREDQLLGEERRKFEEWKRAQQAWLDQQQIELTQRQAETKQYEDEMSQMERDIQSRERQVQKQQQTFQANQRQIQLAEQQHAQQMQQNQLLLKQQADQLAAVQANQSQQQQQLAAQEQQQAITEQQLEQQRLLQQAAKQELAQRSASQTQQAQLLSQRAQQAQAASLANRHLTTSLATSPPLLGTPPVNQFQLMGTPTGPIHTYIQDREEPKSPFLRQSIGASKFVDPDFKPDATSVLIGNGIPAGPELTALAGAQWQRVSELLPGSVLFRGTDGGPSGADIVQGTAGDMWFLNALSMAAVNPNIILNLVVAQYPDIGMYEFRFWKGGRWVTVVVDDYIPLLGGRIAVSHCSDPLELWVTLLEKAYAKLHGSYQSLNGGSTSYALVDVTGGATEFFQMNTETGRALMRCGGAQEKIRQCMSERWLCAVTFKRTNVLGVIPGRSYSCMDIIEQQGTTMVKLRNPWGVTINTEVHATFWVTVDQLEDNMAVLQICRTYNFNYGEPFYMTADLDGYWGGQNAGGQVSMSNPQYIICSTEDCSCFFFLSQYDVPYQRQDRDSDINPAYRKIGNRDPNPNLCCGAYVLQCDTGMRMNNPSGSILTKDVVKHGIFIYGRQISSEFRLPPAKCMCIMPCQLMAGVEAPYQLYIFSNKPFTCRKTLGEGAEQSMPLFTIQFSTPPAGVQWDPTYRSRVVVERQTKGEALEEDDEKR